MLKWIVSCWFFFRWYEDKEIAIKIGEEMKPLTVVMEEAKRSCLKSW
ncbi:MAG: hypothetical protein ACLU4J_00255 [Butyricimonas paravirosa]